MTRTRRCPEREPAESLRDKSNVIGGWLPSLTLPFDPVGVTPGLDGRRSGFDAPGMTLAKVQESVKELSAGDRAELLDWLWDGLQPEGVLRVQERWAAESEERIEAVDRGELPTVDGRSAMQELRRSLGA